MSATVRIVGALFIVATISSSLGFALVDSILDDQDVLAGVSSHETQILAAGFLLLVNAVAVVIIPFLLYPIFRRHNESLARLYPAARIVESVVLVIGIVGLLSLLTLSEGYEPALANAPSLQASSDALVAVYDWGVLLGVMFFFGLSALVLNSLLYQSQLVPRWLSVWGLLAAAVLMTEGFLEAFDIEGLSIMSAPIAVQEMVFAVWLIAKGFSPTIPSDAAQEAASGDRVNRSTAD